MTLTTMGARLSESRDFQQATDALIERARQLVPVIRARAAEAEALRRLPDETMADAEAFFPALVPKRWGGMGLGSRALCEVARELAHGDASTAWTVAFLMEHSWMACHLPWEAQEELFADRPYILASAPLTPGGTAARVAGGFRVTGTFRYASAVWNSAWTFATAVAEEEGEPVPYRFLFPLSDVTVNDDWFMSGMVATSSASVTADNVFVPERRSLKTALFDSADEHPGAVHEEAYLRYPPLGTIRTMMAGISLGCAETCVEIARERLASSKVWGVPRRELTLPRVRWGQALQKVRCAQLLWRHALTRMIVKCDALEPWSEEEAGQAELDMVTVVQMSQKAVHTVCDGMGSSAYKLDEPLQRYRRDIDVMASHLFLEPDFVAERATRVILGLGYLPTDPPTSRPPRPSHGPR
jgi:3-hydroxy-9,10-secoandrosta-1,3,5(10)-triene-9,17-dione monooxygenase